MKKKVQAKTRIINGKTYTTGDNIPYIEGRLSEIGDVRDVFNMRRYVGEEQLGLFTFDDTGKPIRISFRGSHPAYKSKEGEFARIESRGSEGIILKRIGGSWILEIHPEPETHITWGF